MPLRGKQKHQVANVGVRSETETFLLQRIIEFEINENQHKHNSKIFKLS